jgi:hypothetical protein
VGVRVDFTEDNIALAIKTLTTDATAFVLKWKILQP